MWLVGDQSVSGGDTGEFLGPEDHKLIVEDVTEISNDLT